LSFLNVAHLIVRAEDDPHVIARPVQEVLRAIDPDVRPNVNFASDGRQSELKGPKTLAILSGLIGASALGLAVIGLFGVTAFVAEQRRHEVSVRMTLGATGTDIFGMLLRDSLRPVAIGLVCGLGLALASGRMIQGALYGVSSHDPVAVLGAVIVLLTAAIGAVIVPARRAARLDPAQILRQA
jgi:ABC-type antimicrobial peptide transport system permease subunit